MFYKKNTIFLLLAVLSILSCTQKQDNLNLKQEVKTKRIVYQQGYATWYGPGFHGRTTANGETYDMYEYTAAHRTLPLNTIVRVVNLKNGETTVVRINDRGPVNKTLVMDLSKIAAIDLGIINKGSGKIQIEILTKSKNPMQRIFDLYKNLGNTD